MRCELPDLKRCCFCIPLRRGLLAWGYLRLALILMLWIPFGALVYFSLGFAGYVDPTALATIFLLIVDFLFNISLLIAAHSKNYKLLRVYYYYIMICSVIITVVILVVMAISGVFSSGEVAVGISLIFISLATQGYIAILVRSEIVKLEKGGQFQFVNNATQAQVVSDLEMGKACLPEQNKLPEKGIIEYS